MLSAARFFIALEHVGICMCSTTAYNLTCMHNHTLHRDLQHRCRTDDETLAKQKHMNIHPKRCAALHSAAISMKCVLR